MFKKSGVRTITRKAAVLGLSLAMTFSMTVPTLTYGYTGFSGEFTRSERLTQPRVTSTFAKDELGVVNFETAWGDKEANIASMDAYIEEADEKGTKILVFPEMCVTGYVSSSDPESTAYKWAVESAETKDGPTAKHFAELADKDDMWIIYGATETIEENGKVDKNHAYNSAFVCSPDGEVTTYQKITPVEGSWCTSGENPVIIDAGDYGKLGISICYDTYSTPELERYYSAMGCNLLINPTATGGGWSQSNMSAWEEYYKLRLESIASRDGFLILSSDLVGNNSAPGNTAKFPGGSIIMNAIFNGPTYLAGADDESNIITNEEGLLTNSKSVRASTGSTCSNSDFNPELYVDLYSELADKMEANGGVLRYSANTSIEGPKAAVVNMTGYWGNKTKTIAKMKEYIEEAGKKGVDILVFPETVLTGYGYVDPSQDPFYKKFGVSMQVYTAETIPGKTTNELSKYAKKYNMYIIFGMTEKDEAGTITDGGVEKVYNSAAILYPNGKIDSYQKIHRAGLESKWSVTGKTPKIIETKWGKIGVDICRDGHFYPELGRYYAAMGCTMFIHPTATTGNAWYRSTRIGSYVDRDGMAAITCNLLGGDGIYVADGEYTYNPDDIDENGDFVGGSQIPDTIYNQNEIENDPYWNSSNWLGTGGIFNSTSFIATKGSTASSALKPRVNYNGTGAASEGFEERGKTSPLGLEIAEMDLTGTGFSGTQATFKPALYAKLYDKLATLYRGGYTSKITEKETVEETTAPETSGETTTVGTQATTSVIVNETTVAPTTETTTVTRKTTITSKTGSAKVKKAVKAKASVKLTLSLKKIKSAKKYKVQISTTKNFKKILLTKTVKKVSTVITSTKLKNKANLYIRVKAVYSKKSGKWSKIKAVTIK